MSQLKLIYDDSVSVVPEVMDIVGITHYGDLLHGKKRLSSIIAESAESAGIDDVLHVRGLSDLKAFVETLGNQQVGFRFLYLPSNVVALGGKPALTDLFGKLRWLRQNVLVTASAEQGHWSGAATVDLDTFRRLIEQRCAGTTHGLQGERRGNFADIGNGAGLIDLGDKARLLKFLGTHFEVRHFNSISYDDYTIRKSSHNKAKIRQEYRYWNLLPEEMKFWFVQPYDLREDDETASYAMERLNIPDMALQWIHGAVTADVFRRFLDRVFHFLQQRPRRQVDSDTSRARRQNLYRDKLIDRMTELRTSIHAPQLNRLLQTAGTGATIDSFDTLTERYLTLLTRLEKKRSDQIAVIGHGDLCFSNILYEKGSNLMRLIDPRGADEADNLWVDPYYDVAKLSHSILGNYDFINNGLYDVTLDESLTPMLNLYISAPLSKMQETFEEYLLHHGFYPPLVRLYEASLFLSMAPLHIDVPSKALAFLINANGILTKLEQSSDF